jgi:hypothetical protein
MKQYKIEIQGERLEIRYRGCPFRHHVAPSSVKEFELLPIPRNVDGLTIQMAEMKRIRPCYFSDQVWP